MNNNYVFITNRNEIVQENWRYSYDGGGFPMIIPEEKPVTSDMVGKPAHESCTAWEYFLKPE